MDFPSVCLPSRAQGPRGLRSSQGDLMGRAGFSSSFLALLRSEMID